MAYKITISGCQAISFTTSGSTASGSVINCKSCVVYATADCCINIGGAAVSTGAASIFVPANTFLELDTIGYEQSTMQAKGVTASGTLYISPLAK